MKLYLLFLILVVARQYPQQVDACEPPRLRLGTEVTRWKVPWPFDAILDFITFPITPLLDAIHVLIAPIYYIDRVLLLPVTMLIYPVSTILDIIVVTPLRIIRNIIYLPMDVLLFPLRVFKYIADAIDYFLRYTHNILVWTLWLPYAIVSFPIRLILSPIRTIAAIEDLPEGVISIPLYLIYRMIWLPIRCLLIPGQVFTLPLGLIQWIASFPITILIIPIRILFMPLRILRYFAMNFLMALPAVMPLPVGLIMRLVFLPIYIGLQILGATCLFSDMLQNTWMEMI